MNHIKKNSNNLINIVFCIKINDKNSLSFPNQYVSDIVEASNILYKISKLQKNYAEIFCRKEESIRNRMIGLFDGYEVCFVESYEEVKEKPNFLKVYFSDVVPGKNEFSEGVIFVVPDDCFSKFENCINLKNLSPYVFREKALKLISILCGEDKATLNELKEIVGFEEDYNEIQMATTVQSGFYNRINIAILESLRINVKINGNSSKFEINEVQSLVNRIIQIRSEISSNLGTRDISPSVQLYISDTSSSLEFDKNKKNIGELLKKYSEFDSSSIKDAFVFAGRGLVSEGSPENILIAEIEKERLLLDALIVLSAANNVAPVVKLPLSNNRAFQQVMALAASDRNNGRKTHALMKQVREAFSQYLANWLEYMDNSPSVAIKLVSNFPLEWTHHEGLPIMVRHEVSRIPVTPGNVSSKLLLDSKVIKLSLSSFKEILFISSFEDNDPIRNHMKEKIYGIKNILKENESILIERSKKEGFLPESYQGKENAVGLDIRINWIDVSNAEELIDAINNNPCAVTVFDLHGSHKVDGGGCIHLRNGYIHASQLVGQISVSPIVILSTCDASPVDKGHGSMAEAFFLAGAKTVISSALPINSDLASTFLARLLVRLQIYLPEALNNYPIIRWSTFFSGMIRRAYYAELVGLLQKKYKFDSKSKTKLLFDIGIRIDPLNPDWVESVNKEITGMLNIAIDELEKFITDNVQFVECMKYFQLGRPELIVIFPQNERILASSTV